MLSIEGNPAKERLGYQIMKHITIILAFLMTLSTPVSAEDDNLFKGKSYGSFMFFEEVPNALFFEDDISKNDSFEFRKAIRNHDNSFI